MILTRIQEETELLILSILRLTIKLIRTDLCHAQTKAQGKTEREMNDSPSYMVDLPPLLMYNVDIDLKGKTQGEIIEKM